MADRSEIGRVLNDADVLFTRGRFAEADALYRSVLDANSSSTPALARRGEIALLGNRLSDARDLLLRALVTSPGHPRLCALLAEAYYREDRFAPAATYFAGAGQHLVARKLESLGDRHPYETSFASVPVRVPFLTRDPLPLVRAWVNGSRELTLMIDTGGAELILDRAVARDVGMSDVGGGEGMFAAGQRADVRHGAIDVLRLDGLEVRNVPVTSLSTERFGAYFGGRRIDGVIGTVLLYHFVSRLDYPREELVLWPRAEDRVAELEREAAAGRQVAVPFWMVDDHYLVAWGQVNREPMLLLVDSGLAGKGFTCPASTVEAVGIVLDDDRAEDAVAPGGTVRVVPFTLAELSVGGLAEWQVPGSFGPFPEALEQGLGMRIGGVVSHAFLARYAVTLDFSKMRMFFEPAGRERQ